MTESPVENNQSERRSGTSTLLQHPSKTPKLSLSTLYAFCTRQELTLLIIACLCAFIHGASRPALSFFFGSVINSTATAGPDFMNQIIFVTVALAIMTCIVFIVASVWFYLFTRVSTSLTQRVQRTYLASVLSKDIAWFDLRTPAEIPTRLSSDIEKIQNALASRAGNFVMNLSQAVCGLAVGFAKGWQIALVILACIPVIILSRILMAKSMAKAAASSQSLYAQAGAVAEEVLSCIRTVAAFGGEDRESNRYDTFLDQGRKEGVKVSIQVGLGTSLTLASMFACYSLAIFIGGILIRDQVWNSSTHALYTGADIYVILSAVVMAAFALGNIGPSLQAFTEGTAALEGLLVTINEPSLIEEAQQDDAFVVQNVSPLHVEEIKFENVTFRYPSRPEVVALQSLSLTIQAGQKVALVGESGSGKSTIISLLERFYDPEEGSVQINGMDIRAIHPPTTLRHLFGYVGQEPIMFATSIRENLMYGCDRAEAISDGEINEALQMANVLSFINSLPDGLDTYCGGSGGSQMSGGQKQRIAIARALLRKPQILLLDEATSALDNESEKMVQKTIDNLQSLGGGLTTISVAHRLSTIRNSDVIFVLERGGILAESGSHSELMDKGGLYKALVASQDHRTITRECTEEDSGRGGGGATTPLVVTEAASGGIEKKSITRSVTKTQEQIEKERIALIAKSYKVPWKRLFRLTYGNRWLYVPGIIGAAGKGAAFPVHALIFSSVIAWYYIPSADEMMSKIRQASWIYFGLMIGVFVFTFMDYWSFAHLAESFTLKIRSTCFRHILSQDISFFDKVENAPAKLLISLSSWANKMNVLAGQVVGVFIEFISATVTGLTVAFLGSAKLTGILIGTLPLLVGGMVVVSRVIWNASANRKDDVSSKQAALVASEAVQNMRTIRALTCEKSTLALYQSYSEKRVEEETKQSWKNGIVFGLSGAIFMVPYAIGFYVGGLYVERGELTLQNMMQVLLGLILTSVGAGSALAFLPDIKAAKAACHDIFQLLDTPSKINPFDVSKDATFVVAESVVFDNVFFAYPERPNSMVLRGLSFSIQRGQKVALVGPSGSGKSTVMGLLLRFYDPVDGTVQIGKDIKSYNVSTVRSNIGYVGQEPVLFNTTMEANVRYGKPEASIDDLERVRIASKLDFVSDDNVHWDTVLGPRGGLLSGGQKQRTAIARALIRDPEIMILDEATSALDSASEKVVQKALDAASQGRTTFVIAHRLSTIEDADVILVLVDGQLAEQGSHKELLAMKGVYYQLYRTGNH